MVVGFHKEIFESSFENDSLVVVANGLGINNVILGYLKLYADSSNLILFIDVESNESLQNSYLFFTERLLSFGIKASNLPTLINQEHSSSKVNMYKKGGVYFSQASIFVLDFLTHRIPVDMVNGIIINNADGITDQSTEHLLLNLYREQNKKGFIKAFSTNPHQISNGLGKVQRTMKYLKVQKLFLWPRFHQTVSAELDKHPPDLVELSVPPSENSIKLIKSVKRVMQDLYSQLRRKTSNKVKIPDQQDSTDSNDIMGDFENYLQNQITPIIATLGNDSKQIIANIKILKNLLTNVLNYDSVVFFNIVLLMKREFELKNPEVDDINQLFGSSETENLIKIARDRVFHQRLNKSKNEIEYIPTLDNNPKWNVLYQILKEIEQENKSSSSPGNTIVFTKDERSTQQLQSYLHFGEKKFLMNKFETFIEKYKSYGTNNPDNNNNYYNNNNNNLPSFKFSNKHQVRSNRKQQISDTNKLKKKKLAHENNGSSLFDMGISIIDSNARVGNVGLPQPMIIDIPTGDDGGMDTEQLISKNLFNQFYSLVPPPYVIIHPGSSENIFEEIRPKFVVIYDPDIRTLRMVEVYKASNPGIPLRVYFITYSNSPEEQQFLNSMYREKSSFERLIHEKTNLIFDNTSSSDPVPQVDIAKLELLGPAVASSSRFGGMGKLVMNNNRKRVIIDSFEFKSALPVVLYNKGFEIIPLRLEVGDYVITPTIAVERKSLNDLIGSFQSGRLYTQIEAMSRAYPNPVLLIEFDLSKPFLLIGNDELKMFTSTYSPLFSPLTKLTSLSILFPKLRILWSRSPYSTVHIYEKIKQTQPEPDPETIAQIPESNEEEYSYAAQDVLKSMPGVTKENIKNIMNNVESLHELSTLPLSRLKLILKSEKNANLLFDYLNS